MSTLEARDIAVYFHVGGGRVLRAVDDVSFTLRPGETVALVGESGSGKSTVVRALAGLQKMTAGTVLLDDAVVSYRWRALRSFRSHVQIVFQDPFASLNPVHTVGYHLARPLRVNGHGGRRKSLDTKVLELLRSVNLSPAEQVVRRRPHELSGGQRQRVAIARALAPEPSVLLADEPVSMLDVSVRLEILNLLADLERQRNLAMLYVTHDLATARHFSTEILVMYRGRIVERGTSDDIILRSAHPYTRLLASAIPDPTVTKEELNAARRARQTAKEARSRRYLDVSPAAGCPFRPRCGDAMDVCATDAPPELSVKSGHTARCWLYAGTEGAGASVPVALKPK